MDIPTAQPTHATPSPPRRYLSGGCRIDLATRQLQRDGADVGVEAKVFDLIALLVEHADRALSKREINDALWPNRPVTDAALSQLLRKARRALGDDGDARRYIRTVHGRGLQWVAPLTADDEFVPSPSSPGTIETDATEQPKRRMPRTAVLALAAALAILAVLASIALLRPAPPAAATPIRIAVLPTEDRTGEPELAWVRHGLAGLIAGLIVNREGIEVNAALEQALPPGEIDADDPSQRRALRDALGATHVLASELRRLGPLYELDLRLIALAGGNANAEVLRGSAPAALAADGAARVQARFRSGDAVADAALDADIGDPFIAEVYARGIDAQLRGDHASARKYFEICLDHDSRLLRPRLQLAIAQGVIGDSDASSSQARRVADEAQARGRIDLHVLALRQLARLDFQRGHMDGAADLLDTAMARLPANGHAMLRIDLLVARGAIGNERGRWQAASADFEQAWQLAQAIGDRRREALALLNLAVVEIEQGDAEATVARLRAGLDAARAAGDGALEMSALLNLGGAENNAGRPLNAVALLKQSAAMAMQRSDPAVHVFSLISLARIAGAFGRDDDARAYADAVLRAGTGTGNAYWQAEAHWALATLAAQQERWDDALSQLDDAYGLYVAGDMRRNAVQVLADVVDVAARAGDAARAERAAASIRELVAAEADDGRKLAAFLPLIDAQLRYLRGQRRQAVDDLGRFVAERGDDRGPVMHSALRQLGRWQLDLGDYRAMLAAPAWTSWLREQPDAAALRIEALRMAGRIDDADAEQARLDELRRSPALAFDADLIPSG